MTGTSVTTQNQTMPKRDQKHPASHRAKPCSPLTSAKADPI
jgi:hypothetical protein